MDDFTTLSASCEMPVQPSVTAAEQQHPRFAEYRRYVRSMDAALLEASSFSDWLRQQDDEDDRLAIVEHPRHPDYVVWLRENVNCKPRKTGYLDFWSWLSKHGGE